MRLVGVGFGRTGTMSLKGALEELGVPTFHMIDLITGENRERDLPYWIKIANNEDYDWDEVFEPWEATVDWPAASRWKEMVDHYSDLPALLNYRDFDGWYRSCENTILAVKEAAMAGELPEDANRDGPSPELWGVIEKLIWQGDFQGNFKDRDWVRQMYYDRIEEIKAYVPEDRLVVWELGVDGWEPICEALGVDVPDKPFPRLHDTNEFRTEFGLEPLPAYAGGVPPPRRRSGGGGSPPPPLRPGSEARTRRVGRRVWPPRPRPPRRPRAQAFLSVPPRRTRARPG
jgi:hypothetical protein